MVRLFHTADLHLGLKFTRGGYSPDLRKALVDQRLRTLESLVATASERQCEVFVIAGDLFDTPRVTQALVRQAAEILARFDGIVAVLPGNHDYAQEEDPLWPRFADVLGEGHHVLRREQPCDLSDQGVPLVLFPGVCGSRHSKENAIGWVSEALAALDLDPATRKVGVAHGSLEGLSPDFNGDYFPMTHAELKATGLDAWLLGHTHVRHPDRDRFAAGDEERVFFPATPEPDGFDCRHGGHAWILEIDDEGGVSGESLATGHYRFHQCEPSISGEVDLAKLRDTFADLDPERALVKLALSGRVPESIFSARADLVRELEKRCLYLEADLGGLLQEIRMDDIEREFTRDSFPHQLLASLASDDDADPEALQLAWELVKEAQSS